MPNSLAHKFRYNGQTFMVLALHKLVHLHPDEDDGECDLDEDHSVRPELSHGKPLQRSFWGELFGSNSAYSYSEKRRGMGGGIVAGHDTRNSYITAHTEEAPGAPVKKMRTLQRFHGGPNEDRMAYMEKHSALTKRQLAVSAEQVSMFLTSGTRQFRLCPYFLLI